MPSSDTELERPKPPQNGNTMAETNTYASHKHSAASSLALCESTLAQRKLFTSNLQSDALAETEPAGKQSLSLRLFGFLRNETQILTDSLDIDRSLEYSPTTTPALDLSVLNESIQQQLDTVVDDYNRFQILLGYHPLVVPPEILLRFYNSLDSVHLDDQTLLLKSLVFHNCWEDFWAVVFGESTTLNDVDSVVDLLYDELAKNKNLHLGVWDAIRGARVSASSESVFRLICEAVEYKFDLQAQDVALFTLQIGSVEAAQTVHQLQRIEENSSNSILIVFCLRKHVELGTSTALAKLQSQGRSCTYTGFASFLLAKTTDLRAADYLAKRVDASYNDLDYHYLLRMAGSDQQHLIYVSMCRSSRKVPLSEHTYNHLIRQFAATANPSLFEALNKLFPHIQTETWAKLIKQFLVDPKGCALLKRLQKRQEWQFTRAASSAIASDPTLTDADLLQLLALCRNERSVVCSILGKLQGNDDVLAKLVEVDFTASNTMELWRFCMRNKLRGPLVFSVFDRVLHKTWPRKEFDARIESLGRKLPDDFRNLYRSATIAERLLMHRRIRLLAEAISVGNANEIAEVLSLIGRHIYKLKSLTFVKSSSGKEYIFRALMRRTLRNLYRDAQASLGDGVSQMRRVVVQLPFKSVCGQATLFEHIVMEKPHIALEILRRYEKNKSFLVNEIMSAIEHGILQSALEPKKKLDLFQQFQRLKKELHYKSKLGPRTTAMFGQLVFDVAETADLGDLDWLVHLGTERKVPMKVMNAWLHRK